MKAYVKPELFVERYELSQHIAACGIDVHYADTASCKPTLDAGFWGSSDTVFNNGRTECSIDISNIEAYCYTVGTTEAGKPFNS